MFTADLLGYFANFFDSCPWGTASGRCAHSGHIVSRPRTRPLYTIMVTGAIWEHEVYGRYLFAPAFFWEDMISMLVLTLHTAYLAALLTGSLAPHDLMMLALSAYVTYVINAAQFVLKLRAARLSSNQWQQPTGAALGASR